MFESFSTEAQELVQQTTAVNAEQQVELEEAGALRKVFPLKLRSPTAWLAVPVRMTNMHTIWKS